MTSTVIIILAVAVVIAFPYLFNYFNSPQGKRAIKEYNLAGVMVAVIVLALLWIFIGSKNQLSESDKAIRDAIIEERAGIDEPINCINPVGKYKVFCDYLESHAGAN